MDNFNEISRLLVKELAIALSKEMTQKLVCEVAKEIAQNTEAMLETHRQILRKEIHDQYIRPLQEARVLKKVLVAEMLDVSPATVTNLIDTEVLQTTADGRVTEFHLREYLTRHVKFNSQST